VQKPAGGQAVHVSSDLGTVSSREGTFELWVWERGSGPAIDSPRELRLAVGKGRARLTSWGERALPPALRSAVLRGPVRDIVPAGVAAVIKEHRAGIRRVPGLDRNEWQNMLGRVPEFVGREFSAAEVPAGIWILRHPGRRGPTPGSLTEVTTFYSRKLKGVVLRGQIGSAPAAWCYDATADRWRRVPLEQHPAEHATPPPPPGCRGAVRARSPKLGAVLLYAGAGEGAGTWVCRGSTGRWEKLQPPANPPSRRDAALCYDPSVDLFILYGGSAPGSDYNRGTGDTWVFRLRGGK